MMKKSELFDIVSDAIDKFFPKGEHPNRGDAIALGAVIISEAETKGLLQSNEAHPKIWSSGF